MIVQDVFNTKVVRVMCEVPDFYDTPSIHKNLERAFHLAETYRPKDVKVGQEGVGKFETMMGGHMPVEMIPGLEPLMAWISVHIMNAAPYYVDFKPSGFQFFRTWANKMYEGAEGKAHQHGKGDDDVGVAIFYLQVPENSSDLVFLEGDVVAQKTLDEYQDETKIYANVKQGELVFHDNKITHAITKHNNVVPRICLVFEFRYLR